MSTMPTFYNCTWAAIKNRSGTVWLQKYTFEVLSSLEKSTSVHFDLGYIRLCQLAVHSFNCKIQIFVFCLCACII